MNQDDADELLARAKAGTLTSAQLEDVEHALIRGEGDAGTYTLLHIVGLAGAPSRHEPLVAGYLEDLRDPMLTGLALRILTNWWDLMPTYRHAVLHFLAGDQRDEEEDVLGQAVSVTGEYLRGHFDRELAQALLACSPQDETEAESRIIAMARAVGMSWQELPSVRVGVDLDGAWAKDVVRRFAERLHEAGATP